MKDLQRIAFLLNSFSKIPWKMHSTNMREDVKVMMFRQLGSHTQGQADIEGRQRRQN